MRRYLSAPAVGMTNTVAIGNVLDRAPRPYTAPELADLVRLPLITVMAFLRKNTTAGRVSSRPIPRIDGRCGRPILEYWRGQQGIWETFGDVNVMDGNTERKLLGTERPVAWRDGHRTAWSVDESGMVTAIRDRSVVRLGHMESAKATKTGVTVRIAEGPTITFRRDKE